MNKKYKFICGYEDTHKKIKSRAAAEGVSIAEYLDKLTSTNLERNENKKNIFKFP